MGWRDSMPMVLYDDKCAACTVFAGLVHRAARGGVRTVGHYTRTGERVRAEALEGDALSMFWFLKGDTAYGGRSALIPLARQIFSGGGESGEIPDASTCSSCRDPRSVLLRSVSLFSRGRKIKIQ